MIGESDYFKISKVLKCEAKSINQFLSEVRQSCDGDKRKNETEEKHINENELSQVICWRCFGILLLRPFLSVLLFRGSILSIYQYVRM